MACWMLQLLGGESGREVLVEVVLPGQETTADGHLLVLSERQGARRDNVAALVCGSLAVTLQPSTEARPFHQCT